ncbi:flagellar basal body rod protein FlgC [Bellilinea sp.]
MSFWESLRIGASGLLAQRLRLDTIANNIANAQTTRTAQGGPYQRKDVVFMPENKRGFLPPFVAARRAGCRTGRRARGADHHRPGTRSARV